jgi:hypothetical protein
LSQGCRSGVTRVHLMGSHMWHDRRHQGRAWLNERVYNWKGCKTKRHLQSGRSDRQWWNARRDHDASMWGVTVADVPVSKMSKSLVRWGEIEKGKFVSSKTACQKTMMRLVEIDTDIP